MEDALKYFLAANLAALNLSSLCDPRPSDESTAQLTENAKEYSYLSARAVLQRLSQPVGEWHQQL